MKFLKRGAKQTPLTPSRKFNTNNLRVLPVGRLLFVRVLFWSVTRGRRWRRRKRRLRRWRWGRAVRLLFVTRGRRRLLLFEPRGLHRSVRVVSRGRRYRIVPRAVDRGLRHALLVALRRRLIRLRVDVDDGEPRRRCGRWRPVAIAPHVNHPGMDDRHFGILVLRELIPVVDVAVGATRLLQRHLHQLLVPRRRAPVVERLLDLPHRAPVQRFPLPRSSPAYPVTVPRCRRALVPREPLVERLRPRRELGREIAVRPVIRVAELGGLVVPAIVHGRRRRRHRRQTVAAVVGVLVRR